MRYPETSRSYGYEGTVVVSFVVDKRGRTRNFTIAKSSAFLSLPVRDEGQAQATIVNVSLPCHDACMEAEAVRILESMPCWKPGLQNGKPVDVTFTLSINFRLKYKE